MENSLEGMLYGHGQGPVALHPDTGRLNLAIATSMREIIDDEGVGQTRELGGRLVGTAEYIANQFEHNNRLSRSYNFVLIVTDDVGSGKREGKYVPHQFWKPWDESASVVNRDDYGRKLFTQPLDDLVHNLPSSWRKVPRKNTDERVEGKILWEENFARLLDEYEIDVLLSDSLMVIFGMGLPYNGHGIPARGMFPAYDGRMLNIHPAITQGPHRLRGDSPNQDAIHRLKYGYVIERNGNGYEKRLTEKRPWTGASLFKIDPEIDNGEVVTDMELTPVYPNDHTDSLRVRNYQTKNYVACEGLVKYASLQENRDLILRERERRNNVEDGLR